MSQNNPDDNGSNPFTADLKGDLNLDASPDGVSQIFGSGGENRKRLFVLLGILAVVVGGAGAYLYLSGDGLEEELPFFADSTAKDAEHPDLVHKPEAKTVDAAPTDIAAKAEPAPLPAPAAASAEGEEEDAISGDNALPVKAVPLNTSETIARTLPRDVQHQRAVGVPSHLGPENGSTRFYDESAQRAAFTWQGGPAWIKFSRTQDMKAIEVKAWVTSGKYYFHQPYPGTWYWQVSNNLGSSDVHTFVINPPVRRKVVLSEPADGATLASGGKVVWTGDTRVAFYRVELGDGDWTKPAHRFATSGTELALKGVSAGSYKLRLGSFSEVSGQWEYSTPIKITVQ